MPSMQSSKGMTLTCARPSRSPAIVAGTRVDCGGGVVTDGEETNQFVGNAVVTDDEETNQFVGNAVVAAGSLGTASAVVKGSAVVAAVSTAVAGSAFVRFGGVASPSLAEHPATFRRSMQTCCS
jgi:hypothetical protein